MTDLLIRNGTVVTPDGVFEADISVEDGRVSDVSPGIGTSAKEEFDASGLHILPGGIDAHVHFNEPGRTAWEGFETGSKSLAAGGITAYIEMPLNAYPPTTDGRSFDAKLALAEKSSLVDFSLFGGLVPGNLPHMEELAERGVVGFKAFMSATGTMDFHPADDLTLYEGMAEAARLGLPVLVHAENREMTDALAGRAVSTLRTTAHDYLGSRPVVAELEAINRAILFAEETRCSLHIVHVSTGRGVALVAEARSRGVDVSCETCAHYLVMTDEDVERLGAVAKCAPPLRPRGDVEGLWEKTFAGEVSFVTSDHSPCPPEMKAGDDFFRAWGGISGCQSLVNVMLDEGFRERGMPLERIAALVSGNVAERFRLSGKGCIAAGMDADFVVVDADAEFTLEEDDLFYRHKVSPYVGRKFRGKVVRTVVRGTTVFEGGKVVSGATGKFMKPETRKSETKGKA